MSKVLARTIDPENISTIQNIGLNKANNLPPNKSLATSGKYRTGDTNRRSLRINGISEAVSRKYTWAVAAKNPKPVEKIKIKIRAGIACKA